jgi:T5SS/PEP-CTERM-associated repeat protein
LGVATVTHAQYSSPNQTNILSGVISNWTGSYDVGGYSYDCLQVSGGADLNDSGGFVGYNSSGFDSATVAGSGTIWRNFGTLYVGWNGNSNSLQVLNGGLLISEGGYIGLGYGNSNSVLISGTQSVWSNTPGDGVSINANGYGNSLTVSNGGTFRTSGLNIGSYDTVQVTGIGSVLTNDSGLVLDGNYCQMNVVAGATVFDQGGYISDGGNNNSVVVIGATWNNSGSLTIDGPVNSFLVSSGAVVNSQNAYIGYGNGDYGDAALLTGIGTIWSNSANLYVGYQSSANTLTISNHAMLFVGGTLSVYGGGTLTASSGSLTGTVLFANNGATYLESGTSLSANSISNTGEVVVNNSSIWLTGQSNVNTGTITLTGGTVNLLGTCVFNNFGTINAIDGNIGVSNSAVFNNYGTVLTSNNIPVMTSIVISGSDVHVSFRTGQGGSYAVEYSGDLVNWTTLEDGIPGTNGIITVVDPGAATLTQQFYHALLHLP